MRELAYLDALGIPRQNIVSIEKNEHIFKYQQNAGSGIMLFHGEAIDFLKKLPHRMEKFSFVHLDVEGTYLNQIDPAMASLIISTLNNPSTLVAACSTVGRDTEVIWEGIKSLAIFLWLAKEETLEFVKKLATFYRIAKYKRPLRLAIRDLFWLRSQLEHSVVLANAAGFFTHAAMDRFFAAEQVIWARIMAVRATKIRSILEVIRETENCSHFDLPGLFLEMDFRGHLIYHSVRPWNQSVYLAEYALASELFSCREWARKILKNFSELPLISFSKSGRMKIISKWFYAQNMDSLSRETIWKRTDILSYEPREIAKKIKIPAKLIEKIAIIQKRKEVQKMTSKETLPRDKIRELVNSGKKTGDIMTELNLPATAFNSVRATVARAHRLPAGKSSASLYLTEKEKLVFSVIPECAEKTAHGPRIRRIYPCIRDMLKKKKKYASPSVICGLIKKLTEQKVLSRIITNKVPGERLDTHVYAFDSERYGQIRFSKTKAAKRPSRKKLPLQSEAAT